METHEVCSLCLVNVMLQMSDFVKRNPILGFIEME